MTRRGVSLLEVVAALAVLGVVAGLVVTAIPKARAAAAGAACRNHLRQQGAAILAYEAAKGRLPPGGVAGPFDPLGVPVGVSHGLWPVLLGPLGDDRPYTLARPWDHPANAPSAAARLRVVECPGADEPAVGGPLVVNAFLADLGLIAPARSFAGPLPVNGRVRLVEVSDGASNTILVAAACDRAGAAWHAPETAVPVRELPHATRHGGPGVCLADGAVRVFPADTSVAVLAALATRAGGEAVGE